MSMNSMKSLFGDRAKPVPKKRRVTERGELMDFFLSVLNPNRAKDGFKPLSHSRLGHMLTEIPTRDLYYIKSQVIDYQRRNGTASACKWFNWALKNPEEVKNKS